MSATETPEPGTERITRSTAARNPRRRARQSDNDSLQRAAPRRKRSKLSAEAYAPRNSTEGRPAVAPKNATLDEVDAAEENDNIVVNGHIDNHVYVGVGTATKVNGNGQHRESHRRSGSTPSMLDGDMPVRGGKKATVKRVQRTDGTTTLCSNQCYSVKLLPSTPKELKKEGLAYRGSILGVHALAVTQEKALVWDYHAHIAASNVRTFDMPFPTGDEQLPFGMLVPGNGIGQHDMGLVLISAVSGKVVYYDSIDHASSLSLFQEKRKGIEGTIPLAGSEVVTDIVSAAYATFAVTLSSGRIVALTLRDMTGTAKVQSQFMKITDASSSGVFGSFSGFLKANYRRDLTAVRTRVSRRGAVHVVGLTEKAEVLLWDLEWSGRSEYITSVELREGLVRELRETTAPELAGQADYAVALDFAIQDKQNNGNSQALVSAGAKQSLDLFILLKIGTTDMHRYVVVEVSLPGDGSHSIERIHHIQSYHSDGPLSLQQKPRLVLPKPGHTFYVLFENATVLASTADLADDSPEAQLHASYLQQDPFEDAIHLKGGKDLAFTNIIEEPARGNYTSAVAFVKGAGVVRISAADATTLPEGPRISAKSRIAQAVFHGYLQPDNIMDFSRQKSSEYTVEEIEEAAVAISDEILRAETAYPHIISHTQPSMELALATKAKALKALVSFVTKTYPALRKRTMWRLLWDAEKLAAGQQLWLAFEDHVALTIKDEKRAATVMDELAKWFETGFTFYERPDLVNEEPVRRFFIGGLHHMEKLLTNLRLVLQAFYEEECSPQEGLKRVIQADDIWLRALETAFAFRSENCADYGIPPELIDDGILIDKAEYSDLPEFWTSSLKLVDNTLKVADLSRDLAQKCYEPAELDDDGLAMATDIANNNARLVQIYCLQAQESINWYASRHDKRLQDLAERMKVDYDHERYKQLRKLASVGRAENGMALAEKYRDMNTLADMVIAEDQYLQEYSQEHDADKAQVAQFSADLQKKIQRYFSKYQTSWSDAFFDKLFASSSSGAKLLRAQKEWRKPLAEYLRGHPNRAKLCWINDVTAESDYLHASKALSQCAQIQETKLWSKKVELSLSKLAFLAAEEAGQLDPHSKLQVNGRPNPVRDAADQLAILQVQERLLKHFTPEIQSSLDEDAEIFNCVNKYGSHLDKDSSLARLLEHGITTVLQHGILEVEELIDTLTLISVYVDNASEDNLQGSETLHALIALDAAAPSLPPSRFETLLALVWKRAYIYDDWNSAELQVGKKKSDEERKAAIQLSTLWQILHQVLESEITTKPDARIRILQPSHCIGAACQPEDLSYRFPEPDILDPIIHDLRVQDEVLERYVTDRGLDEIALEAERDVKQLLMAKADEEAEMRTQERHLQESFGALDAENGVLVKMNGHTIAPNGYEGEDLHENEDGDVEME